MRFGRDLVKIAFGFVLKLAQAVRNRSNNSTKPTFVG